MEGREWVWGGSVAASHLSESLFLDLYVSQHQTLPAAPLGSSRLPGTVLIYIFLSVWIFVSIQNTVTIPLRLALFTWQDSHYFDCGVCVSVLQPAPVLRGQTNNLFFFFLSFVFLHSFFRLSLCVVKEPVKTCTTV